MSASFQSTVTFLWSMTGLGFERLCIQNYKLPYFILGVGRETGSGNDTSALEDSLLWCFLFHFKHLIAMEQSKNTSSTGGLKKAGRWTMRLASLSMVNFWTTWVNDLCFPQVCRCLHQIGTFQVRRPLPRWIIMGTCACFNAQSFITCSLGCTRCSCCFRLNLPGTKLSQKRHQGGARRHVASICGRSSDLMTTFGKVNCLYINLEMVTFRIEFLGLVWGKPLHPRGQHQAQDDINVHRDTWFYLTFHSHILISWSN